MARSRRVVGVVPLVDARKLDRVLDYGVPAHLADEVGAGALVACPLRGRTVLGVVVAEGAGDYDGSRLADLLAVVEDAPRVGPVQLELADWMARYYAATRAQCLRLMLPPRAEGALTRDPSGRWRLGPMPMGRRQLIARAVGAPVDGRRGAIVDALTAEGGVLPASELCRLARTTVPTLRAMATAGQLELTEGVWDPDARPPAAPTVAAPVLTAEQEAAVAALGAASDAGQRARLLHGVTGSGKTEVYIRLIERMRAAGRATIVLVPEIALTPQTADRLRARLGGRLEVWHSGLTVAERVRADARIRRGEADVVLGARSAVFAPVPDVGLIVVDEEHDGSYKQDAAPRYDARQVAYRRAAIEGAMVVYGSATPRPESWYALDRVTLSARADGARLPHVEIVDMRVQAPGPVSRQLARALHDAADRRQKAIILLNRRGLARQILCRGCGWIARCPACDVPMVVHDRPTRLVCHHCGTDRGVPEVCPRCDAAEMIRQGSGTQGLEEALAAAVPGVPLVRLDTDVVGRRGDLEARLEAFARPGAAILLGTQMVAKGHDLPDVTVAAVLDADGPLQQPDFRAEERAFSLIVQLAGRAGRRGEPSRVFVQAWEPAGRAVRLAADHDVVTFLDGELARRQEHDFPPFGHLVRVVVEGDDPTTVRNAAAELTGRFERELADVRVLGPAPMHRVRGRTRRSILVRADRATDVAGPIRDMVDAATGSSSAVRITVDVDPQDT